MKTVAILGAGAAGLTSAVAAMEEGMQATIFEMTSKMGGVWSNGASQTSGQAWPGMKVNVSRYTSAFSNFPWPVGTEDFPTTEQMNAYLESYAEHFQIKPYIKFETTVLKVFEHNNKWIVRSRTHDIITEQAFDSVMVATGQFTLPYIPPFPNVDVLGDKALHSAQYKTPEIYQDQKVLIVGGSFSGASIAEELSNYAQVTHLVRRPRWMIGRYRAIESNKDSPLLPRDLIPSEASDAKEPWLTASFQRMLDFFKDQQTQKVWKMTEDSPFGFVVADTYLEKVESGKINPVRGEIKCFERDHVNLQDGNQIDFDKVIFCTGFRTCLNYLPEALSTLDYYQLYQGIFPMNSENLVFIGMHRGVSGATFPVVELQARLACRVLAGKLSLPVEQIKREEIISRPQLTTNIFYMNMLAEKLGVKPEANNLGAYHMLTNGAFVSARFRIEGPNSVRDAALAENKTIEYYRRHIIHSKDDVPTLASLCESVLSLSQKHLII